MNIQVRSFACALVTCLSCGAPRHASAAVTIIDGVTIAYFNGGDFDLSNNTGGATVTRTNPDQSPPALTTTTSVYGPGAFTVSFEQVLPDSRFTYGQALVNFTVDVDTPYLFGGSFTNSAGYTTFSAGLYEYSTSIPHYAFQDVNDSNSPFMAELGNPSGNVLSSEAGSLSGTLLAGHSYTWSVVGGINSPISRGASATGNAFLKLGDDPPTEIVPEPASIAVWACFGLVGIGLTKWRSRSTHRATIAA